MPETKDKFSVVMPVLNAREHLRAALDSILEAMRQYGNAELIVLDNGSNDGSYEILQTEYGSRARVLQVRGVTVGALRNHGTALADGEFLTFIDSDCRIVPDYFSQALGVLRSGADITGSKVALEDSPLWVEKTWHALHAQRNGAVNYINSGNLVVRRQAFLQVGGFDEKMIGCEDADLGARLVQNGFKMVQAHAVHAVHLAGDKTLPIFFRKHTWRGMGMFGMLKNEGLSKPLLITFAHLLACLAAVVILFVTPLPLYWRLAIFVLLVNLAPAFTIVYRIASTKTAAYSLLQAMLLYHVYYLARFYAMWKLILSWRASPEDRHAMSARLRG